MEWVIVIAGALALSHLANAHSPNRGRFSTVPSFFDAWFTTELTFHWAAFIAAWTISAVVVDDVLGTPVGVVGVLLFVVATAGHIGLGIEGIRTRDQVHDALAELRPTTPPSRFPRSHIAVPFLMGQRRAIRKVRDIEYTRVAGQTLRLDLTLHTDARPGEKRPVLMQIHGGAWVLGHKRAQAQPLLNHLAAQGWVCVNVDYRLSPAATFPDHLIDCKSALAWIRAHIADHGGDPDHVCISGQSAGGHLAALMGLTANDPRYQPGFERVDTSVRAVVANYGIYDLTNRLGTWTPQLREKLLEPKVIKAFLDEQPQRFAEASPLEHIHAGAPPFFVLHGDRDNLVPVDDTRVFVDRLREASGAPVLYAELKGGHHGYDLFPSFRAAYVTEGVEQFLQTLYERAHQVRKPAGAEVPGTPGAPGTTTDTAAVAG